MAEADFAERAISISAAEAPCRKLISISVAKAIFAESLSLSRWLKSPLPEAYFISGAKAAFTEGYLSISAAEAAGYRALP